MMDRIRSGFKRLFKSFARSRNGNVAMMTAVALPILLMVSAGAIDLHNLARVKSELQDALDAASLAAARSPYSSQSDIQRVGMDSLSANMPQYFKGNPGDVAVFTLTGKDQVSATATVQVKTIVANILFPPYGQLFDDYMPMSASSDVLRASRNVEVAMALDITGSMSSYMSDLKSAAKELVGIVVQGDQAVYTTRVALVPYAAGVNVGNTLAPILRSELIGTRSATAVNWKGKETRITSISNGTFTATAHGLSVGDSVYLSNLSGNAQSVSGKVRTVSSVTANTFKVSSFTSSGTVSSSSTVAGCLYASCYVGVTADKHGVETGEYVTIASAKGMTNLNARHVGTRISDSIFTVPIVGPDQAAYTSGAKVTCNGDGCSSRIFDNMQGNVSSLSEATCVSERPRGSNAPTDAVPGLGAWLGRAYLESSNSCPTATFMPLTNVSSQLTSSIDSYKAAGSTAGQVGIEMAWYAISPTFGSVFPEANRPNVFDTTRTIKAVVLMTDGEFNTPFCKGVIAKDAGSGSGNNSAKINCNATNGDGFSQSVAICNAMKKQGIIIYTVGFNLGSGRGGAGIDTAYEVMEECATNKTDNFFPAATGTDLKEAFKAIGRDITRLRIAR